MTLPCRTDCFCARTLKNDCALWILSVLHDFYFFHIFLVLYESSSRCRFFVCARTSSASGNWRVNGVVFSQSEKCVDVKPTFSSRHLWRVKSAVFSEACFWLGAKRMSDLCGILYPLASGGVTMRQICAVFASGINPPQAELFGWLIPRWLPATLGFLRWYRQCSCPTQLFQSYHPVLLKFQIGKGKNICELKLDMQCNQKARGKRHVNWNATWNGQTYAKKLNMQRQMYAKKLNMQSDSSSSTLAFLTVRTLCQTVTVKTQIGDNPQSFLTDIHQTKNLFWTKKWKERGHASTSFTGLPFYFPYRFLAASLLTSWSSYVLILLVLDLLLLHWLPDFTNLKYWFTTSLVLACTLETNDLIVQCHLLAFRIAGLLSISPARPHPVVSAAAGARMICDRVFARECWDYQATRPLSLANGKVRQSIITPARLVLFDGCTACGGNCDNRKDCAWLWNECEKGRTKNPWRVNRAWKTNQTIQRQHMPEWTRKHEINCNVQQDLQSCTRAWNNRRDGIWAHGREMCVRSNK